MTTISLLAQTGTSADQERRHLVEELESTETVQQLGVVSEKLREVSLDLLELLPLVAIALAVFAVFWVLGSLVVRVDFLFRWAKSRFTQDLAKQFTRAVFAIVGLLIGLELLNATALVSAALGAAGVAGIALGFAFKDLVENYIAGVLLSTRQPFAANDFIRVGTHEGKVVRLTSRATVLLTLDGNHLRLPNAMVFKSVIENFTRNPTRRFEVAVGVGVTEDLEEAEALGIRILTSMDAVLKEPPARCVIDALGDSNVQLRFYAWVDQRESDFLKTRSEALRLVKTAFDAAEIDMPEPIYRVVMSQAEPAVPPRSRLAAQEVADNPPLAGDTSVERHIDEQVATERANAEPDLLNPDAPLE